MRNAHYILGGKPEGKRLFGRPKGRWDDSIIMGFREIGWKGGVYWMHLAQDRDQMRTLVNTVMKLRGR
jgi:hypothetical protein